jgi:hypothetical protein
LVTVAAIKENMRIAERATDPEVFYPVGYLIGSDKHPSSITIYGITGGAERWLKIHLDATKPPLTYAPQALAFVRRTPLVPFHGKTTGFVINYASDHAVLFDLIGDPVEVLTTAYLPGHAEIILGGRKIDATARPIFST